MKNRPNELFRRHQPFPRAAKSQLNSKGRRQKNVDFTALDFLKVARGNFGSFGQRILRQFFTHPLAAHICAENLDPLPFFLGKCHNILHRVFLKEVNDTYIVKNFGLSLPLNNEMINYGKVNSEHKLFFMKTIGGKNTASRNFIVILSLAFLIALSLSHAQGTATASASQQEVNSLSDTEVMLQTIESVPPAPASTAPRTGTFWSAAHAPGTRSPWPPLPSDNGLPLWNLGDGIYLLDDLQVDYSLSSSLMSPDGFGLPGGGTNGGSPSLLIPPVYTTNDLWLQMIGVTNTTAYLTIHPPWTVTNGVWDLYYTTNLSSPLSSPANWTWLLRSFAGVTNLAVNNATDPQGFYWLDLTNDPVGNDSQGTNFWVAFPTVNITITTSLPSILCSNQSRTVAFHHQSGGCQRNGDHPRTWNHQHLHGVSGSDDQHEHYEHRHDG